MSNLISNRYVAQLGSITGVGPMALLKGFKPAEKITAQSLMEDYVTEKSAKNVSNEELVRMSYVPLALAELVWDYAMTIIDMASNLRIPATKKLCLAVRKLQERYRLEEPRIFDDIIEAEMKADNAELFEEGIMATMNRYVENVRFDLKSLYPQLEEEWVYYRIAIQQCLMLYQALVNYTVSVTGDVGKAVGIRLTTFMPSSFYKLGELIPCFIGDKPMSAGFKNLEREYVKAIVTRMKHVKLLRDKKAV